VAQGTTSGNQGWHLLPPSLEEASHQQAPRGIRRPGNLLMPSVVSSIDTTTSGLRPHTKPSSGHSLRSRTGPGTVRRQLECRIGAHRTRRALRSLALHVMTRCSDRWMRQKRRSHSFGWGSTDRRLWLQGQRQRQGTGGVPVPEEDPPRIGSYSGTAEASWACQGRRWSRPSELERTFSLTRGLAADGPASRVRVRLQVRRE